MQARHRLSAGRGLYRESHDPVEALQATGKAYLWAYGGNKDTSMGGWPWGSGFHVKKALGKLPPSQAEAAVSRRTCLLWECGQGRASFDGLPQTLLPCTAARSISLQHPLLRKPKRRDD